MSPLLRFRRASVIVALAAAPLACEPKPVPDTDPVAEVAAEEAAAEETEAEETAAEETVAEEPVSAETETAEKAPAPPPPCADGVVKDDGTVETGYGFVPSATFGEYVQAFSAAELPSRRMRKVCVCWLKTRARRAIDFEVVFYAADGDRPAAQPYATVKAKAKNLPRSVDDAGRFYQVDVSKVTLEPGTAYIGARWDPSASRYLFICTDRGEGTAPTSVFFREDRSPRWASVEGSNDPTFQGHRAIGVRAKAATPVP